MRALLFFRTITPGITIALLISIALVLGVLGFQSHEGQPATCNNHHGKEHPCACQRATKCHDEQSEEEDSKCQTYCRKTACKCINPCET